MINAAEYALDTEDDATAAGLVAELAAAKPAGQASTASWRADVFGRWALRRGEPLAARKAFAEEVAVARAGGLWEEAFRGEVGLGRALRASGRNRQAVAHLKAAQSLLERMIDGVPIAEGRGAFLRGHDDGVRFLVEALVDQNETREALRTARLACAAALSYVVRADRSGRAVGRRALAVGPVDGAIHARPSRAGERNRTGLDVVARRRRKGARGARSACRGGP